MNRKVSLYGLILLFCALALAGCQGSTGGDGGVPDEELQTQPTTPPAQPCPTAAACPDCPACPTTAVENVPFQEAWESSAHSAADAEAFTHWDEDGEIPVDCAKCHSTPGFLDFLGEDDSEAGTVDAAHETGTVITCEACHNASAANLSTVVFPSGLEVTGLGPEARCMQCHQGVTAGADVSAAIAEAGLGETPDTASDTLQFVNIHYYFAGATLYGSLAGGGFEFEGQEYHPKFEHVENYDSCVGCHTPHSLEVQVNECAACHEGVAGVEDIRDVRMPGSSVDFDGDGNIEEGIYYEVETLRDTLYQALQSYSSEVAGAPLIYSAETYPYFFLDTNENNEVDEGEAVFQNQFNAWTPRLLQAAYNYQASVKDPGAYAHNPIYVIQLLYDSIAAVNEQLSEPVSMEGLHRDPPGHFLANAEAFRHWDEDGMVPAACTKCHTAEGLPFELTFGEPSPLPPSNSLDCLTCHSSYDDFALRAVEEVEFPSGAVLSFAQNTESNICLSCHQGREWTGSVDAAIQRVGVGANEVSEDLTFVNPHYFAAAATLFGSQASGAYQYEGQQYNGRFNHVENFDSCAECHNAHNLIVQPEPCSACHQQAGELREIRLSTGDAVDYDGDGDVSEGIALEIETMHEQLLPAIQAYAQETAGAAITYDPGSYPYWFNDTNSNGQVDPDEANVGNRYVSWTPAMLRAAYNYQYVSKDPGAFAHNSDYILQVLYDSLQDIGGSEAVANMVRPPVQAAGEQ